MLEILDFGFSRCQSGQSQSGQTRFLDWKYDFDHFDFDQNDRVTALQFEMGVARCSVAVENIKTKGTQKSKIQRS